MSRNIVKSNHRLQDLIGELRKVSLESNVNLWGRIASDLEKSTRSRRVVNLFKLSKSTKDGETALVPGKVLSVGDLDKKLTVAAYSFSEKAKEKINKNGRAISIVELLKENPKGSKVRIVG